MSYYDIDSILTDAQVSMDRNVVPDLPSASFPLTRFTPETALYIRARGPWARNIGGQPW